jgi:hypothetical protein
MHLFKQDDLLFYVLGVIFIATLIRSALGFGEALVAVPLLALRIPLQTAAPLAVMVSVTIAALIIVQDWQKVHFKSAGWLLVPMVFGIPLGLWLLLNPHQQLVKIILAAVIICFAVYFLSRTQLPELKHDSKPWLLSCGFIAGPRRRLRHERPAACRIRGLAPLVTATFSRHSPGIFPASQPDWFGRIPVERALESETHPLLLAEPARDSSRYLARPARQSPIAARKFSQVRLCRFDRHWPPPRAANISPVTPSKASDLWNLSILLICFSTIPFAASGI